MAPSPFATQPYLILNDADPEWWLAFDPSTGEQGAVPASCVPPLTFVPQHRDISLTPPPP